MDAAQARLSIFGARAVEHLIEALEGSDNRVRARAMPLLAMIQDRRGHEPLCAMLLDRNARMRQIAARCLASFPSNHTRVVLERLVRTEKRVDVRVAAVRSLVELYAAGQDSAVRRLLDLLVDGREPIRVREAAFALLDALSPSQRRGIQKRLVHDDDPAMRRRAAAFDDLRDAGGTPAPGDLEALLRDLASEHYGLWDEAVRRLSACGAGIVDPLIAEMQRRGHDAEYCLRAGMALKALGPRRGRALVDALDRVEDPLPLQILVEVVGAWGTKSLIYRLKDLIDRLARKREPGAGNNGFDPMLRVCAKAHLELARIGSRVAIQDLREAFRDPARPPELENLTAIEWIGKRDELPLLLQAHATDDPFVRTRIAEAVRVIMKRERIRRNNRWFQTLAPELREALERILPPPARRPRRPASSRLHAS